MARRKRMKERPEPDGLGGLESRLELDRDELDREALEQPHLYYRVAEAAVQAAARRDRAKQDLEDKRRAAEMGIRRAAEVEGRKLTEKALASMVEEEPPVAAARDAYLAAKEEADRLAALRAAYDQRASMLKVLAQLYASEYFVSSSVTAGQKSRDESYKAARRAIAKTLQEA